MNIETLRIFCDVVQHQSFSRGATINGVSQSAATQSVHRVEEHFGVQLVDRSKRPFVLTPEGQACYEGFREVLELYDSVEARVRSLRMDISGLVRVAAIYSVGLHDMRQCMQDFMRRYPKAKVRLEYLRPNKVYDAVNNAEVDLGIISYPATSPDIDVIPLRSERMVLVCQPAAPPGAGNRRDRRAPAGRGFRGLRSRPEHSQGDRPLLAAAVGEHQDRDGIRQYRDDQAGGGNRGRDQHPAGAADPRGLSQRQPRRGPPDRPRVASPHRHHPSAAEGLHAHRRQVRRIAQGSTIAGAGGNVVGCVKRTAGKMVGCARSRTLENIARCSGSGSRNAPRTQDFRAPPTLLPGGNMNRQQEFSVTFQPGDKQVYALAGTRLQEAATAADLVLDAPCGGEGTCGKCRVVVLAGAAPPTADERNALGEEELHAGCRLACQATVCGPMSVLVPATSLVDRPHQILTDSCTAVEAEGAAAICKRYVELAPPDRGDDLPDLARLQRRLAPFAADVGLLRELPRRLREAHFQGTAVLDDDRLIDFEPGNTEWDSYGVAIDLGTTTLVAALLDLATGRQVRVAARLNPQTRFGDDVLARILLARSGPDGLEQLQRLVGEALDEMIGELCDATGIARRQVYQVTLAGNTTMQQLFCGIDPGPLGEVPFVPAVQRGLAFPAAEGGLQIHPRGRVYVLPIIGAFVGGDIVGGILATGLAASPGPALLIDIGTNGETRAGGRWPADGHLDRGGAGLRRRADHPGDAGQSGGDREGRRRSAVARPRHRPRSAAGALRLGLDRRHGRALAARHHLAPGPPAAARGTPRGRAAGPCPPNRGPRGGSRARAFRRPDRRP